MSTFAEEIVTSALVQDVTLPNRVGTTAGTARTPGTLALITLDNGHDHTKPSTFGPAGLDQLRQALDSIEPRITAGQVQAVGITGKPFIFAVGADLKAMGHITSREQALAVGRLGHGQFRRLGELGVPTFAYLNGAVMGGGLELALHCTYRTMSSGVPALALPECFLGLVPGLGGTYLLPRLIGPKNALSVIIENALNQNRMLKGLKAHQLGISDAVFEPADFLEESLAWTAAVLSGEVEVRRPDVPTDQGSWDAAIAAAKAFADAKVNGAAPAPYRALELVALARTADRDTAFAAEDEALADLLMGEELRSGLYSFDLVQRRAKRPAGAPDPSLAKPVTKVGVVGAGLMAGQLALLFAQRLEVPVVMTDLDQARVAKGVGYVHAEVDRLLAKGRVGPDKANRLKALVTGSTSKVGFADAGFVIEAVFEEMGVKRQVLAELERIVTADCVLATNTSSLSVTGMASGLEHPERVVGFHFFNPVAVLPLLEVVRGERTDEATLATAFAVGRTLRKSCVLVKDAPAFVVNRLFTRLLSEVTRAVDEGTPFDVADRALGPLGMPMSPFVLLQLVGPAVALHVAQTLNSRLGERFYVSPNLERLVEAGKPGIWSWNERGEPYLADDTAALFEQGDSPCSPEQLRERALDALAGEARSMLDEGVVADARDLDLCMLLGAGWPFHLGGITPYLDRSGVSERVTGQRFLPVGVASVLTA